MIQPMSPEQFKIRMKQIADWQERHRDEEISHKEADELLCEALQSLGYGDGVEIFEDLPKWYA